MFTPLKTCPVVTEREGLDLRIITHVVHIWSDRLRLTSICVSQHDPILMGEGSRLTLTWRPRTG